MKKIEALKNSFIAFLKNNWFLIIIFIIGLVVRTIYLNDTIAIGKDQIDHIRWANDIFANYGYIWHGARMRGGNEATEVFLGPFYIYLLSLPAKIGGGYFLLPTILNGLLNAFSIFLIYYLTKIITNSKTAGIISAILFAFSTAFIVASRTIWNPWYLPFFVLITFISFIKLIQGKEKFLIVFILFLSFSTQLHASALLFVPAFILLWFFYRIKIKHKMIWLYAWLAFIISYLPMIYHELKHHFENSRNFLYIILNPSENDVEKVSFFRHFLDVVKKFSESFSSSLDGRVYESAHGLVSWFGSHFEKSFRYSAGIIFLFLCLFLLMKIVKKNHLDSEKNLLLVPFATIFLFILGANFFGHELFVYYFATVLPITYIIIAYGLAGLNRSIIGKVIMVSFLIFFSYVNLNSFYFYVKARQHRAVVPASELMNPDMILKDQIDLLDFVIKDSLSQGAKFEFLLNWGPVNSANIETYYYLINLKDINIKENNDIVYLIIDPRIKPLDDTLNDKKILIDRVFGSIRLIKYQIQ